MYEIHQALVDARILEIWLDARTELHGASSSRHFLFRVTQEEVSLFHGNDFQSRTNRSKSSIIIHCEILGAFSFEVQLVHNSDQCDLIT